MIVQMWHNHLHLYVPTSTSNHNNRKDTRTVRPMIDPGGSNTIKLFSDGQGTGRGQRNDLESRKVAHIFVKWA